MQAVTSTELLRLAYRQWRTETPGEGITTYPAIVFSAHAERVAFQLDAEEAGAPA